MNLVTAAALAPILAKSFAELTLLALSRRHVRRLKSAATPASVAAVYPERAEFERALDYSAAKSRDGAIAELVDTATSCLLVAGGAAAITSAVRGVTGPGGAATEAIIALAVFAAMSLPGIFPELATTFGTEARFGFNRTTPALWLADKLKGAMVALPLGFLLFLALAAFLHAFPASWWIAAAATVLLFQIAVAALFPVLLLPLFNKLTPLADEALRDRLLAAARRAGFPAAAVFVMDGSRRSSRANAFFAGLGGTRRIVLFDTLIEKLTPAELEAVLAHEIGHWKRGHILKSLLLASVLTPAVFAFIGWLSLRPDLAADLGFRTAPGATSVAFGDLFPVAAVLAGALLHWLAPLTNSLSRKHEYEADAYAADLCGSPDPLVSGLRKLYVANSGNPLPHPAYALFHHSHPTLPEREHALASRRP